MITSGVSVQTRDVEESSAIPLNRAMSRSPVCCRGYVMKYCKNGEELGSSVN